LITGCSTVTMFFSALLTTQDFLVPDWSYCGGARRACQIRGESLHPAFGVIVEENIETARRRRWP
jgi:hypothetical protein